MKKICGGREERDGVSDHALLRWLERVYDVDVEYFRDQLRAVVRESLDAGASCLRRPEANYLFRDGTLVTVLPPGSQRHVGGFNL